MAWEAGIGTNRSLDRVLERCDAGELAAGRLRWSKPGTGETMRSDGHLSPPAYRSVCEEGSRASYLSD